MVDTDTQGPLVKTQKRPCNIQKRRMNIHKRDLVTFEIECAITHTNGQTLSTHKNDQYECATRIFVCILAFCHVLVCRHTTPVNTQKRPCNTQKRHNKTNIHKRDIWTYTTNPRPSRATKRVAGGRCVMAGLCRHTKETLQHTKET